MKENESTNLKSSLATGFQHVQQMFLEGLKGKRISYLTLPLLFMATVTEFVILATGWNYQRAVCVPPGMGVTFFGIGPIGATILAVELLKLPLAIWTASRSGWQKSLMIGIGLPLICLLTFQLVKDMAVYEMGVAMTPASKMLEKAAAEEIIISQLNGELSSIGTKKDDREKKMVEFAARKAKAKTELEEELKRNDTMRQDAISLTDYQQKELSEVEARQAAIVRQFNNDTVPLTKALAELRERREAEFPRAATWNAEQARIDNAYNAKMAEYNKKKAAFEKDKVEYASAGFLKRHIMGEPVDPGAAPEREINKIVKPSLIGELDSQIAAKEAELTAVNNQRRTRVAQVSDDAKRVREEFDHRSTTKREQIDKKREELLAAQATLENEWRAEQKQIDQDLAGSVKNVDGLRAEIDAHRKVAEGYYETREASIKNTQVHRIATTVEIIRGLLMGKRPVSITATAKERGDIYTDQVSMVRIWVYPVLAFIVAFLPTLMVEVGFSTIFHQEEKQRPFRFGFLGQNLHWIYTRAGRLKILRAERLAREAATAKSITEKTLAEKTAALQAAQATISVADAKYAEQTKKREEEWDSKFATLTDSLSQATMEKDAQRDFQQLEIERQVQLRQNTWSDRLDKMREELDAQHATFEAERSAMAQEQNQKLLQVSEDCRNQVSQIRRQMADAELAAGETASRLALELKAALNARDEATSQLQRQGTSGSFQVTQVREEAARELEKAVRQGKHNLELAQLEFANTLRQRNDEFQHELKKREQELSQEFNERLLQEQGKTEQDVRRDADKIERLVEGRVRDVDARWNKELQQRDEAAQARLKQREQQWQSQAESRVHDAETRLAHELLQKEEAFQLKLRQREHQMESQFNARQAELQTQWDQDLRRRESESTAAAQREREWAAKLNVQIEMAQAAEKEWTSELELARGTVESFKALLVRAETERDEARMTASEGVRQLQDLKKKSMEASSLLNAWANGNHPMAANG